MTQAILVNLILILGLVNAMIWLGISGLILYHLYIYTRDKNELRKSIHPDFRKWWPGL
jgi:tetrahydromethanopterin S-methyltransferase subunit D